MIMQERRKDNIVNFKDGHTLPEDTTQALRVLIELSEKLLDLAERETQALVRNDIGVFAAIQDEKDAVSMRYADMAKAFHARLEEFRGSDIGLLDRLEELQHELRDKTVSNNKVVEKMFMRSQEKVHDSLLTVQELTQQKPVRIEDPANHQDQNKDEDS